MNIISPENGFEIGTADEVVILPFEKNGEYYIERLGTVEPKPVYSFVKRIFDIVASLIALILLIIPMLVISVMIKCASPGTVFYKQERLGLNGKKITVLKFRTMCMTAEENGPQWAKNDDDPRCFPLGVILRKAKLDEIPQFLLTLTGAMSIIGPRPERACFYREFETYIHGFDERLKVKPGITGYAQVYGGMNLMPQDKARWDVEYIKNRSVWLDIKILLKTISAIFHGWRRSDKD